MNKPISDNNPISDFLKALSELDCEHIHRMRIEVRNPDPLPDGSMPYPLPKVVICTTCLQDVTPK